MKEARILEYLFWIHWYTPPPDIRWYLLKEGNLLKKEKCSTIQRMWPHFKGVAKIGYLIFPFLLLWASPRVE